ncbi:hypothetical protein BU16DRAFT_308716 [Lophium mytilinum]|uniref:Uncharacterized protein n=1 Tax=Lophium mytilinum TaxID=390894 RepID=A0A6A6R561_9PEZI|nr:hypothetical protein BU16DRAFT_308716 [Lophium mytilinum]
MPALCSAGTLISDLVALYACIVCLALGDTTLPFGTKSVRGEALTSWHLGVCRFLCELLPLQRIMIMMGRKRGHC